MPKRDKASTASNEPAPNRIWIELDKPRDKAHADKQCELANAMLKKLGAKTSEFWWSERDHCYCYGDNMGYVTLSDRGHWLNLDFLAR